MATRRVENSRDAERSRQLYYRIRLLPEQLERARLRVRNLEDEARRLGMEDIL